jgi:glycosyltransferase involved in cell wall biosynthesis
MVQEHPDVELMLIGDAAYPARGWGNTTIESLGEVAEDRFRFLPLPFVNRRFWRGGHAVHGLSGVLREFQPHFAYLIGVEASDLIFQVAWARRRYLPGLKMAVFSMRGTDLSFRHPLFRWRWQLAGSMVDAFFCHCPRCVEVLRTQGKVWQPIYMQTQLAVNIEVFRPDAAQRTRVRADLGVRDDEYLFGAVSRMDVRKGLLDMLDALPLSRPWKFVMIGSGPDQKIVAAAVRAKGLDDRVLLPGYIDGQERVAGFINALDCSVLMSKTLPDNCDTFPQAVAQSMAVGVPVIVSDSGGLPYQVGKDGIVVREGDVAGLHDTMERLAAHPDEGRRMGAALRGRLLTSFSVPHLNRCFVNTVRDILDGKWDMEHMDQQNFTFERGGA